ncbi:O-acetyl-ADP-ribose deacetylase [hydrothermal vent metagenome]|uniref:O-acetyl-ADP-ribose deacetylase n=1 Tax=hydrothermal vent metagenome TaxID=652676 RepID=A0A3B1DV05_9ZZZZ
MQVQFGRCRVELVLGDITTSQVDAIVNAANSQLAGGGGVDGAIHQAAGTSVMQETKIRYPDGCPTGKAVVTKAGNLNAKHLFHAVGPVWKGGLENEPDLLASVYSTCLTLAVENNCRSIAFPAMSTGVYRYPIDLAAEIALKTIRNFILSNQQPSLVQMVLFDEGTYGAHARTLEEMAE